MTLWQDQEQRRQRLKADGVDDGIRVNITPGECHLAPVRSALVNFGADVCSHVLACHEAEARARGHARFFDGVANWREDAIKKFQARDVDAVSRESTAKRDREQRAARGGKPAETIRRIQRL